MEKLEKSKHIGTFTIEPDKQVNGELTLDRMRSSLYVWGYDFFDSTDKPNRFVKGVLHDRTKVSLINCVTTLGLGSRSGGHISPEEVIHFANFFPHYVVFGDQHLSPVAKAINRVDFVIDDATTLFYDYDAFGHVLDAGPLIEQVVQCHIDQVRQYSEFDRTIEIGPYPQIAYFTGKGEIFSANTVLGKISASHAPSYSLGGPAGVEIKNNIFVSLQFTDLVIFEDAVNRTLRVIEFLELLVGRPQNLIEFTISKEVDQQQPAILQVYGSWFPKHERPKSERKPDPSDVLIDAVQNPKELSHILVNWLERDEDWRDARGRFFANFTKEGSHGVDRLIGAANMFDILPANAIPAEVELTEDIKSAHDNCQNIFKKLPASPERDSVLSALGRVGKSTLKRKIHHRAQLLIDVAEDKLPDLYTVIDEAVNCRNHYVHGSQSRIDYSREFDIHAFLTETLEFIFAASDLIEAGWDVQGWYERGSALSHPFSRYLRMYKSSLLKLKSFLSSDNTVQKY